MATASAQAWQWQGVLQHADQPPSETRSNVVLSAHDVVMTYAVRVNQSDVPVTSCRGLVSDIANARMVSGTSGSFLYVVYKPGRAASCNSGRQPVTLVPIVSDAAANRAIDHINDFLPNLRRADVIAGDAGLAAERLRDASQNWGAAKRAEEVATRAENARADRSPKCSDGYCY